MKKDPIMLARAQKRCYIISPADENNGLQLTTEKH
ncbi:hypothetical protein J2T12_002571 [Paenibacillus anaericanus]|nr:hypothetical protein [Paenibacillus anaericanus]